jgi:GxxExxY protein
LELEAQRIAFETKRRIAVDYKGRPLKAKLEIDLLVEHQIIVELKAVESLHPVHSAQVISYLRLTGHPAGLLINFNGTTLRAGLRRLDHPTRYAAARTGTGDKE